MRSRSPLMVRDVNFSSADLPPEASMNLSIIESTLGADNFLFRHRRGCLRKHLAAWRGVESTSVLGHYPIPTTRKEVIIHEDENQTVEQKGGLSPLETEDWQLHSTGQPESKPMQKLTVILADDHTVVRRGLRALLEAEADMSVVGEAQDGRQA